MNNNNTNEPNQGDANLGLPTAEPLTPEGSVHSEHEDEVPNAEDHLDPLARANVNIAEQQVQIDHLAARLNEAIQALSQGQEREAASAERISSLEEGLSQRSDTPASANINADLLTQFAQSINQGFQQLGATQTGLDGKKPSFNWPTKKSEKADTTKLLSYIRKCELFCASAGANAYPLGKALLFGIVNMPESLRLRWTEWKDVSPSRTDDSMGPDQVLTWILAEYLGSDPAVVLKKRFLTIAMEQGEQHTLLLNRLLELQSLLTYCHDARFPPPSAAELLTKYVTCASDGHSAALIFHLEGLPEEQRYSLPAKAEVNRIFQRYEKQSEWCAQPVINVAAHPSGKPAPHNKNTAKSKSSTASNSTSRAPALWTQFTAATEASFKAKLDPAINLSTLASKPTLPTNILEAMNHAWGKGTQHWSDAWRGASDDRKLTFQKKLQTFN